MKIVNIISTNGISGHEKPIFELQTYLLKQKINTQIYL